MNVFILGASRGIGLALAQSYVEDGVPVWGIGRTEKPDYIHKLFHYRALGAKQFGERGDTGIEARNYSRVYLNAAIMGPGPENVLDLRPEQLAELFYINTVAHYQAFQRLFPRIARDGEARVMFIISHAGSQSRIKGHGPLGYRVTKAAQLALALGMADFCTRHEIGLCLINPGWVRTRIGGKNAKFSAAESATGIRKVAETLTREGWGKTFNHDGTIMKL